MDAARVPAYRTYWIAWLFLLILTLVMVVLSSPVVLLAGMTVKAAVILFWFMHLRSERVGLVAAVLAAIFVTGFLLFGLLVPDGRAM